MAVRSCGSRCSESQGIRDEHITPEIVAENIDKVLDLTDAQVMTVGVLLSEEHTS